MFSIIQPNNGIEEIIFHWLFLTTAHYHLTTFQNAILLQNTIIQMKNTNAFTIVELMVSILG